MDTKPLHNDTAQSLRDRLANLSDEEVLSLRYSLINIERHRNMPRAKPIAWCSPADHVWEQKHRGSNGKSGSARFQARCKNCPKTAEITTQPWRGYPDTEAGRMTGRPWIEGAVSPA